MHVAFLAPNAYGHVLPPLPLVRELVRRGHRVSFAVGPELAPLIKEAGAEPVVLPTALQNPPMTEMFTTDDVVETLNTALAERRKSMPVLLDFYRDQRPDLVCTDQLDYNGQLLAEVLGVVHVHLVPTMAALDDEFTGLLMSEPLDERYPPLVRAQEETMAFFRAHGVHKELDARQPAPMNLVFVPPEIQRAPESFDDTFHFIGPGIGDRSTEGRYEPKAPGKPLLYISLGTIWNDRPSFFQACVDAFADTEWQVVMAVGRKVEPMHRVPPNFDIHRHLPQLAVLRQTDVFLTHNGMGSTLGAVYCGVPMVSAAQVPEQLVNANRMAELGLGRLLADTSPEGIFAEISSIADDWEVSAAVADMCRRVNEAPDGAVRGAELIEEFVR